MDKKLTFDEQIEWLQKHYIKIDDLSKCENYLKNISYFFKMISFVKDFNCNTDNPQIYSFDMLKDLSTIDMELRYILLKVCLDIEHAIKTLIIRIVTNNPQENGYDIVQAVINSDKHPDEFKKKLFSSVGYYDKNSNFIIIQPAFDCFFNNPPIWIVIEIATLGKMRSFIEYLCKCHPNNKDLLQIKASFKYINQLRNCCAHNHPLINKDICSLNQHTLPHNLFSSLRQDGLSRKDTLTPLITNISLSLRLHQKLCSSKSTQHRLLNLQNWLNRTKRNRFYNQTIFQSFFDRMTKIHGIYNQRIDKSTGVR